MVFAVGAQLLLLSALCSTAVLAGESLVLPRPVVERTTITITQLPPDARGGKAYRLSYRVPVSIETMWKFKTDFKNDFLVRNKYIKAHRLVSRQQTTVITEDRYSQIPAAHFVWQTTLLPNRHRLEFELLNAQQVGQKFHYGYIQLQNEDMGTRVTQVAYFDFLGASLWADYPWGGGMVDFLTYSARWEQTMARTRQSLYTLKKGQQGQ